MDFSNRKIVSYSFVILIVLVVVVYFKFFRSDSVYEMKGIVTAISAKSISVRGFVADKERTIEFGLGSGTVIEKNTLVFPSRDQVKPGEWFEPEQKIVEGQISDFRTGMQILKIKSSEDLTKKSKVNAVLVQYKTYDSSQIRN